jgi:hypothetical protein
MQRRAVVTGVALAGIGLVLGWIYFSRRTSRVVEPVVESKKKTPTQRRPSIAQLESLVLMSLEVMKTKGTAEGKLTLRALRSIQGLDIESSPFNLRCLCTQWVLLFCHAKLRSCKDQQELDDFLKSAPQLLSLAWNLIDFDAGQVEEAKERERCFLIRLDVAKK